MSKKTKKQAAPKKNNDFSRVLIYSLYITAVVWLVMVFLVAPIFAGLDDHTLKGLKECRLSLSDGAGDIKVGINNFDLVCRLNRWFTHGIPVLTFPMVYWYLRNKKYE